MGKHVPSGQVQVNFMYFSLPQKMAFAAEPLAANASSSPALVKIQSFVTKWSETVVGMLELQLKDHFPESYTLEDLTKSSPESLEHVELVPYRGKDT